MAWKSPSMPALEPTPAQKLDVEDLVERNDITYSTTPPPRPASSSRPLEPVVIIPRNSGDDGNEHSVQDDANFMRKVSS
ncbi:hypothetical protein VTN31DRAFT_1354 [Thermomyces dupontii]|uniref:uncharacterized protein n=1 Tax=Talaromyces thermophilus TaxID=28565 RepID=UPI003744334B